MRHIIVLASVLLSGCDRTPWQGYVYPNKHNLAHWIALGAFESLEQCRAFALRRLELEKLKDENRGLDGDYECGYRCEGSVCKRTER